MLENSTWIAENSGFIQAEELLCSVHYGGRVSPKVAETMFAIVPFAAVGRCFKQTVSSAAVLRKTSGLIFFGISFRMNGRTT